MSISSVIEKCISIVTGKGSESDQSDGSSDQDQNFEQNQQAQPSEDQEQGDSQEDVQDEPVVESRDSF